MRTNKREIAFYTENCDGKIDELVIDFYNRYYEHIYETKEDFLYSKIFGIPEIKINRKEFFQLFDLIEPLYDGEEIMGSYYYDEERKKKNDGKSEIDSKTLWKAIRRELPEGELNKISSFDYRYEKGDYYDYQLLCKEINNCINGKRSIETLMDWLALMMHCLMSNNIENKAIQSEYDQLADLIDGFLFVNYDPMDYDYVNNRQKAIMCRELLAQVKWHNHNIENIRQGKTSDFTTNDVITYVTFGFYLEHDCIYKVCVVDKKRLRINFMFVKKFDYRKDINYTFISEPEFEELSLKYDKSFKFDPKMTANYAANKEMK